MSDVILHQYDSSPFSEKVRICFGIKGLAWRAAQQPVIMPKPDLIPLTGGYRRIPVMQIGADVYCDSATRVKIVNNIMSRHFGTYFGLVCRSRFVLLRLPALVNRAFTRSITA